MSLDVGEGRSGCSGFGPWHCRSLTNCSSWAVISSARVVPSIMSAIRWVMMSCSDIVVSHLLE